MLNSIQTWLLQLLFVCSILALEEIDVGDDFIYGKFNWTRSNLCADPGKIRHGTRTPDVIRGYFYPYGAPIHYSCFLNFKLIGGSKIVCGLNGRWEPATPPTCRPVVCTSPAIPHGYASSVNSEFFPKTTVMVFCHAGYRLLNKYVNTLECQSDGSWVGHNGDFTQELPECIESTCPPLPDVNHAKLVYKGSRGGDHGYKEGTVAQYACQRGFIMNGTTNVNFTLESHCYNGEWMGNTNFMCKLVGCAPPPPVAHGSMEVYVQEPGQLETPKGVAYPVGVTMNFWCHPGYVLKGSSFKFRCLKNGSWQPSQMPTCEKLDFELHDDFPLQDVTCSRPPTIQFGETLETRDRYFPMSTVNYICHGGFRLIGPSQLQCGENGMWSPTITPSCELIIERPAFDWSSFDRTSPNSNKDTFINEAVPDNESQTVPLVTAGCVLGLLSVILILAVAYQRRRWCSSRFNHVQLQQPINSTLAPGSNTHISQYQDQDRVSLIAFADGAHLALPTYEESIRQRNSTVSFGSTTSGAPVSRSTGRYSRFALHRNQDQTSNGTTRQPSLLHSGCGRSSSVADSLGSNDTVTPSEVSTTVTVDTLSSNASHAASAASTRAFCGSLTSFDTTGSGSILNIEGVPLLEEGEKDPMPLTGNHQDVV